MIRTEIKKIIDGMYFNENTLCFCTSAIDCEHYIWKYDNDKNELHISCKIQDKEYGAQYSPSIDISDEEFELLKNKFNSLKKVDRGYQVFTWLKNTGLSEDLLSIDAIDALDTYINYKNTINNE